MDAPADAVAVVTVHYHGERDLLALLASLPGLPVVVIDNSPNPDRTAALLAGRDGVRHLSSGGNVGFARAANLGAAATSTPHVLFANPDSRPTPTDVAALLRVLEEDPGLAAVAPAVLDEHARARGGGGRLPSVGSALASLAGPLGPVDRRVWAIPHGGLQELDWLSGACLLVRREAFEAVGGFDEHYPLYNEDMALGARLRTAGHRLALDGRVRVAHPGGGSSADPAPLWRARGGALGHFVRHEARHPRVVQLLLVLSFGLRAVVSAALGHRQAARESSTVARAILRAELPVLEP